MTKNKQIEEMAKHCHFYKDCNCILCEELWVECDTKCDMFEFAKQLYNAGYRKAFYVACEIFEEIEKIIADLEYRANTPRKTVKVEELKEQVNWVLHEVVPNTLADLKKKYTEGEG